MSLPKDRLTAEMAGARKALLVMEKETTRARDALNAERRRLPMVKIDKEYAFKGAHGTATLRDLSKNAASSSSIT